MKKLELELVEIHSQEVNVIGQLEGIYYRSKAEYEPYDKWPNPDKAAVEYLLKIEILRLPILM